MKYLHNFHVGMRVCNLLSTFRNHNICSWRNMTHSRIFVISDLHVDYKENLAFVEGWSPSKYTNDVLIVAGDVTDNLTLLEATFKSLTSKFKKVFYVSGNHELWIRSKETGLDSIMKFHKILSLCDKTRVSYKAEEVQTSEDESVWIVPLFSWYSKPEEDPEDSLYRKPPPHVKENVAFGEQVWMDNHLCSWTSLLPGLTPAMYFSSLNHETLKLDFQGKPIISFSHFLPRWDLIPSTEEETGKVNLERERLGLGEAPKFQGGVKGFNFARYAGSNSLELEIRKIKSMIHVYGHQHRNRDKMIDGIRYVSHCLGNPKEQKEGWVWGLSRWQGPKQIWPDLNKDS